MDIGGSAMKTLLKSILSGSLFSSLVYVILGLVLILVPGLTMTTLVRIGAGALIATGIFDLLRYVFHKESDGKLNNRLVTGVILTIAGGILMSKPTLVINLVPTILGIALMIEGLVKLQRAIDLFRMKYTKWLSVLLVAVISLAIGILVLTNPFNTARTLVVIIGIGLVFAGLTGVIVNLVVNGQIKNIMKNGKIVETAVYTNASRNGAIDVESVETRNE